MLRWFRCVEGTVDQRMTNKLITSTVIEDFDCVVELDLDGVKLNLNASGTTLKVARVYAE